MSVLRRSRHVAEVSQAFFDGQFIRCLASRPVSDAVGHCVTLRVQVGRAAKVQHPIVTNSCNDYS